MKEKIIEVLQQPYSDPLKAEFIINLFNGFMLDNAKVSKDMNELINKLFIHADHGK